MANELAALQQLAADYKIAVDNKQAQIAAAIAAFEQQISDLQVIIAGGNGATPEQLQDLVDKFTAAKEDLESTPVA